MVNGSVALVFFYGIFWAGALSAIGRYHAFDTHMFFSPSPESRSHARRRFVAGVVIMNIFPALWFWFLSARIVPDELGVFPIMTAALASLSVFGFHRILHAIIATDCHSKFYSQKEWIAVINQWRKDDPPNTVWAHLVPGIGFLIIFPSLPYALRALGYLLKNILTWLGLLG